MITKSYSELITFETFLDRFEYLSLKGRVGDATFGGRRELNQILYKMEEWKQARYKAIVRDNGCDLGIRGRELFDYITVHHINPITIEDILDRNPIVFDLNNLITCSSITHKAIHYGSIDLLMSDPITRTPNDTCPWKH